MTKSAQQRPAHPRVVILAVPSDRLLSGIARYLTVDSPWAFEFAHPSAEALRQLARNPPDGVIAYLWERELTAMVSAIGCPVVNYSGAIADSGMPQVRCDSEAAGRMAAEYFLDRGFAHFAFVGDGRTAYSEERQRGFAQRLQRQGLTAAVLQFSRSAYPTVIESSARDHSRLDPWLAGLPRPLALFAANDAVGWEIAERAARGGLRVPEDIAVLGMDNTALCLLARPPLSSIENPVERVGYEAAAMLGRLMRGERGALQVQVPPSGVVTRHSTDILAVSDPNLAKALRFVAQRYADDISVTDMARAAGLSRRTLEKRFSAVFGRTPAEEIRRVRVERARAMLIGTGQPIDDVAERCGFSGRRWMSAVFLQTLRVTPARYRREHGLV